MAAGGYRFDAPSALTEGTLEAAVAVVWLLFGGREPALGGRRSALKGPAGPPGEA